jgi:hypothetical protein
MMAIERTRELTENCLYKSTKAMKKEVEECAKKENISAAEFTRRAIEAWLISHKKDLLNH